jgi:hypothetical protein
MMATLLDYGWLRRVLLVVTAEGSFRVEYNGRAMNNPTILVDDRKIVEGCSGGIYDPRIIFALGKNLAAIEVRLWPWLTIRSFHLLVEENLVYAEGERRPYFFPNWSRQLRGLEEDSRRVSIENDPSKLGQSASAVVQKRGEYQEESSPLRVSPRRLSS